MSDPQQRSAQPPWLVQPATPGGRGRGLGWRPRAPLVLGSAGAVLALCIAGTALAATSDNSKAPTTQQAGTVVAVPAPVNAATGAPTKAVQLTKAPAPSVTHRPAPTTKPAPRPTQRTHS